LFEHCFDFIFEGKVQRLENKKTPKSREEKQQQRQRTWVGKYRMQLAKLPRQNGRRPSLLNV